MRRHATSEARAASKKHRHRSDCRAAGDARANAFDHRTGVVGILVFDRLGTLAHDDVGIGGVTVAQPRRGADVVDTLERVTAIYGMPKIIRVDNGPKFISKDLDLWAWMNTVTLDFSRPGKPTDNAFVESFNGNVWAECIDQNWFLSLDDARSKCEASRREYNEEWAHSAIGTRPGGVIRPLVNPADRWSEEREVRLFRPVQRWGQGQ